MFGGLLRVVLLIGLCGLLFSKPVRRSFHMERDRPVFTEHLKAAQGGACPASLIDGYTPPPSKHYIYPSVPIQPFYQWENNNGYCGEVSILQAAMNFGGIWMSQFHTRLFCGAQLDAIPLGSTSDISSILPNHVKYPNPLPFYIGQSLNQSGPDQWCELFDNTPNYNAQMEYESPDPGVVSGKNDYAHSSNCAGNVLLKAEVYPGESQASGLTGYQHYMSWMKGEIIKGNIVSFGVLIQDAEDEVYDHEVTVYKIGTNHDVNDPTYYPDDVLYFEDHGAFAVDIKSGRIYKTIPSIPPGANDTEACTPYIYGYKFQDLPKSREDANKRSSNLYSLVLPGVTAGVQQGNDGADSTTDVTIKNWAVSISGVIDPQNVLKPIKVSLEKTYTNGIENPKDSIAGYNYENPMIGDGYFGYLHGFACTNEKPDAMSIVVKVAVSGLAIGETYNLYEYVFDGVYGVGADAKLRVPTQDFNANANVATRVHSFTATSVQYTMELSRSSMDILVYRAVSVNSP